MCRELLSKLRQCNADIDRELNAEEKVAILWEACILNRVALTHLIRAGLKEQGLPDWKRVAMEEFLERIEVDDHPFFRSQDGQSEHCET